MKGLIEALLILGLSGSLAWFAWFWHPDAPAFGEEGLEQRLEEIQAWESVLWVDARLKEEYEEAHIPGALLLNAEDWETLFGDFIMSWNPDVPVVVYCKSQACMRSHDAAKRLREELGAENVFVLKDGWNAWLEKEAAE